ncbi:MAG: EAL domain-containing protein [Proteobacteria bacterium]|nr:EAL domain-containing protein [Pseudomonadota bacterium]NOG61503.1 EAL domain-containing protein [Pseudomonadota bacterium]
MNIWRLVSQDHFSQPALLTHHDHWLCLVAVLLAVLAAWVLLPVTDRFHTVKGRAKYLWLLAGSVAMGTGIWAMHFTAMLAFTLPVPINYKISTTIFSMLPAIIANGLCILLSIPVNHSIRRLNLMAVIMAVGIGTMHYIGMEAIVVPARMYYIPHYFFLSILAAYILAFVGLYTYKRLTVSNGTSKRMGKIFGSIILGVAVSSMHFIAMRATYFQPEIDSIISHHAVPPYNLVFGIVSITIALLGMIIIGSIVDRRMETMAYSLKQSELRFQRLAETTQTAIFTFNDEMITYANPALSTITGYEDKDILTISLAEVFSKEFSDYAKEIMNSHTPFGQAFYEQFEIKTAEGDTRWLYFSITLAEIDNESTGLASACDISEQKSAELNMRHLAYNDQLTQIGNRMMFMDRLEHHLALLKRRENKSTSSVMLLDLDKFKSINDTYGHLKGDELLISVAKRLKGIARNVDTVARLGGDEFVLLLEELDSSVSASIIADRIIECLSKPYDLNGREIVVYSSIGVVELNSTYEKPDQVLHDADIALYRAKKEMHACWILFDQELDAKVKRIRQLQPELKTAVSEGQLQLYYQPIIESKEFKLNGFEALARWQRSNGEWVSPVEFIPLAEDSGLIADIGLWALETACQQLGEWNKGAQQSNLYVSVNVASVSFNDERFNKKIANMFDEFQFKPGQLKLELTERMLVEGSGKMLEKLNRLIELGCELMIDDFGTGYSSLSYLHRLPIRTLKIDRSFVSSLDDVESSVPIVKTIIALAESLNMGVVSEGVETEAQSIRLAKLGSDQLQGYLFAKPMKADEATKFISDENNKSTLAKNA